MLLAIKKPGKANTLPVLLCISKVTSKMPTFPGLIFFEWLKQYSNNTQKLFCSLNNFYTVNVTGAKK